MKINIKKLLQKRKKYLHSQNKQLLKMKKIYSSELKKTIESLVLSGFENSEIIDILNEHPERLIYRLTLEYRTKCVEFRMSMHRAENKRRRQFIASLDNVFSLDEMDYGQPDFNYTFESLSGTEKAIYLKIK